MFGGLYGDLPDAKDAGSADKAQAPGTGGGWSRPQLHVPAKRPAPAMPPSVLRAGDRLYIHTACVQGLCLKRIAMSVCRTHNLCSLATGRGRGSQAARGSGSSGRGGSAAGAAADIAVTSFLSVNGAPLRDEYDPGRPNDYAAIRRQREEARKEAEREAERQEAMRRAEAAAIALEAARPDEARDLAPGGAQDMASSDAGAAASPMAAASGEEAYLCRGRCADSGASTCCV